MQGGRGREALLERDVAGGWLNPAPGPCSGGVAGVVGSVGGVGGGGCSCWDRGTRRPLSSISHLWCSAAACCLRNSAFFVCFLQASAYRGTGRQEHDGRWCWILCCYVMCFHHCVLRGTVGTVRQGKVSELSTPGKFNEHTR